jgi:ribosomal protein S18 acetylase RimI-like enzyme
MHVLGNPHALRFYESCGFREMGTVRAQFGDAIALILDFG